MSTIVRTSVRTAAILTLFALLFTGLMAGTQLATQDIITASAEREKLKLVSEILPHQDYDNALLNDWVEIGPTPELGLTANSRIFRARKTEAPVALLIEAAAPNGYGGRIDMLVAVRADGTLAGVRVTQHKETPGLGDYIDIKKDKNKNHPWITQFDHQSLSSIPDEQWKVQRDGGRFDARAGATISARAVTQAVASVLKFTRTYQTKLYEAQAGSRLAKDI